MNAYLRTLRRLEVPADMAALVGIILGFGGWNFPHGWIWWIAAVILTSGVLAWTAARGWGMAFILTLVVVLVVAIGFPVAMAPPTPSLLAGVILLTLGVSIGGASALGRAFKRTPSIGASSETNQAQQAGRGDGDKPSN